MEGDAGFGFEMVAASLRSDGADQETFFEVLAAKLVGALPGTATVEREGGLFSRRRRVRRLLVGLGEHRYELTRSGRGLEPIRAHVVRGITLKREVLALEDWIEALSRHLADDARASQSAHAALQRLVG